MNLLQKTLRSTFSLYSRVLPSHAAALALKLFQTPKKTKIRERERIFYRDVKKFTIPTRIDHVTCYEMGNEEGEPIVLVHGWDSHPGSLYSIAHALSEEYRIFLFDLPAHGTSTLQKTNLFESSMAMQDVISGLPTDKPLSIISHSFGSAITAHAITQLDLKVNDLVFITSPNRINDIFSDFKKAIGLSEKASRKFSETIEREIGPAKEVEIAKLVKKINYRSFTLIHDPEDKIIPYNNSEVIHMENPTAKLIALESMGHYRILWNKKTNESIKQHLSATQNVLKSA